MKKIYKAILFLGVGLFGLTSCEDFLTQESPSQLYPETVFNSENTTRQAVNKIYSGLTLDHTYGCRIPLNFSMNNDVEIVDALTSETSVQDGERGNCNYNPTDWNRFPTHWTEMYEMVENANLCIEGIRNSNIANEEGMRGLLGEALCLRAMVMFDLVRHFGDVPLKLESTQADGSNFYLPKTDRDVIMDTLLVDLAEAAELLPWAGEKSYTTEHCTKGFAYGLAARIALAEAGYSIRESAKEGYVELAANKDNALQGKFTNGLPLSDDTYPTMRPSDSKRRTLYEHALECLEAIINSGHHQLNPSYENEWYRLNQLSLDQTYYENLYEVAHGMNYSGEMGYTAGVRLSSRTTYFGFNNSSGKVKLTAPYFWSFDHNDLRRDVTCAPYELRDATATQTMQNAPFGIYVAKWDPRKMTEGWRAMNQAVTSKTGYGINWVVMRYSDVLLMYAEVVNELYGPTSSGVTCSMTPQQALAKVRERAFDANLKSEKVDNYVAALTNKESMFEAIVNERAWEFGGEAIRKYDLIRWGLLIDKTVEMLDSYRYAVNNQVYPRKIYYKENDNAEEWNKIDYSSITWYESPFSSDDEATAAGYKNASFWGSVYDTSTGSVDTSNSTYDALQWISSGLIQYDKVNGLQGTAPASVVNRHLFRLGSNTISDSNGTLQNSYNF